MILFLHPCSEWITGFMLKDHCTLMRFQLHSPSVYAISI